VTAVAQQAGDSRVSVADVGVAAVARDGVGEVGERLCRARGVGLRIERRRAVALARDEQRGGGDEGGA
jgi:hypothetical protein